MQLQHSISSRQLEQHTLQSLHLAVAWVLLHLALLQALQRRGTVAGALLLALVVVVLLVARGKAVGALAVLAHSVVALLLPVQ
jgi:hypothetical protein